MIHPNQRLQKHERKGLVAFVSLQQVKGKSSFKLNLTSNDQKEKAFIHQIYALSDNLHLEKLHLKTSTCKKDILLTFVSIENPLEKTVADPQMLRKIA